MSTDPLALDPETMRELGHRTVDAIVDLLTDGAPALRRATPKEMRDRLPAELDATESPESFDALLDRLREDVFPYMARLDHPGYMAFIPACGTFPGALGDFLAAAINPYVGTWMEAAGPSRLELVVLDWFKAWIGYPDTAAGVLVSGGSAANITGLACAREALLGPMTDSAVIYVGDQAHSSLARAARLLGFRPEQVRVLPCDADRRLQPATLEAAIDADVRARRNPLCAVGVAGTTNTGTIDPLAGLAEVCRRRGVWFHVDAAYGGFAAITERGREALRGIELADSVTLDPHKWLYQPFECGSLLVRDGRLLRHAFEIAPDYLKDAVVEADQEVNFADHGLQLSRGTRALKIWLSIRFFGMPAFRAAVDRAMDLAQLAERRVRENPELELVSPASLGIIAFRRRCDGDEPESARANAALVAAFERTGRGLLSSTRLRGRYAIRMCVMNHTTTENDVLETLDWFARTPVPAPVAANGASPAPAPEPHLDALARIPLLSGLDSEALGHVASAARRLEVPAGRRVTRRWDAARDFYLVLEGRAHVERDGEEIGEIGPGDFFGELAALDWGAGFGYARLATVTAFETMQLLVLAPADLAQLMAASPSAEAEIRRAVRERLPAAAG